MAARGGDQSPAASPHINEGGAERAAGSVGPIGREVTRVDATRRVAEGWAGDRTGPSNQGGKRARARPITATCTQQQGTREAPPLVWRE
ncbi:hypothetical protein chiPu_0024077 [Chiloscyllium punctatum]|uniref:Uncharacterized protein n=1 Tax=Chiloscyllium punctatum TaxID=137246 RepID=A0A401TCX4_CHIPU|nr:hypothetical protein [Chiloscyllium punctatum]